ncbi:MAG: bifunctional hydroxymethylpyrimidine kinase/phosphomethylpyrimidine kinase [Gemmatimonadota bacterium]
MKPYRRPIACTVAGSDSGGGAGIQADLKTFHQFGVFGTSVLTAITAQNTLGVRAVHTVPLDVVTLQVEALATDLPPAAIKSGMLGSAELVDAVADAVERWSWRPLVVDPVMVATSGDRLLAEGAEQRIRERLLPLATLVTPNRDEAMLLTGQAIDSPEDAERAARTLVAMGAAAALVKGGHGPAPSETLVDVLFDGQRIHRFAHRRIPTRHTHGTGCTLSAAVTAGLAWGRALPEATEAAVAFVAQAIERAPGLGAGSGPVDHFTPPPAWASPLVR